MAITKHYFERHNDELHEVREGDELVDANQQRVKGKYHNVTIYPESTARDMIKELQRQIADAKLSIEAKEEQLKELRKRTPIDKKFLEKVKSCLQYLQSEKLETAMQNEQEKIDKLNKSLADIKGAWEELF